MDDQVRHALGEDEPGGLHGRCGVGQIGRYETHVGITVTVIAARRARDDGDVHSRFSQPH